MPIYEYRCKNCGKVSEFLEGVGQGEIEQTCKHCGSRKLDKVFSKSFVSRGESSKGFQGDKTCCGQDEPYDTPPCSDDGICKR